MKLKRWVPILLAVLLTMTQIAGVSAEAVTEAETFSTIQEAIEAGREVAYTAKVNWHSPGIVDEETNTALQALFDATSVSGRMGVVDDKTYASTAMAIDGKDVLNLDVIGYQDGASFISSPVYGSTLSVAAGDLPQYYQNLFSLMGETSDIDQEMFTAFMEGFMAGMQSSEALMAAEGEAFPSSIVIGDMEIDVEQLMQAFPIDAIIEAVNTAMETALVVEQIEGNVESASGIECARAEAFIIEKEGLAVLAEAVSSALLESEPPIELILMLAGITEEELVAQGATLEDLAADYKNQIAMLPMLAQIIPDGSLIAAYDCYDAQDEIISNLFRIVVPGEEEGSYIAEIYVEVLTDGSFFYIYGEIEGDGIEFYVAQAPEEVTEEEGAVTTSNLKYICLTAVEQSEPVMQIMIDLSFAKVENDAGISYQNGIFAGYYTDESADGIDIYAEHNRAFNGEELAVSGAVSFTLYSADGSTTPICSIEYTAETTESQGLPFDETTADDIVYPGKMTEEEFADWFENVMTVSLAKTGLYILSQLPDEVVALMITTE